MIHGERVRQAREVLGLTQTDLADAAGVSQPTIARMEAAVTEGNPEVVASISRRTGFPQAFFREPPQHDFPLGSLLFRSRRSMPASSRTRVHRYGELLFETATRMSRKLDMPSVSVPQVADLDPIYAAQLTRNSFRLAPNAPIANLCNLLERSGTFVFQVRTHVDRYDAYSLWTGGFEGRPVIVLLRDLPKDRVRFALSHELGHLVVHHTLRGGEQRYLEEEANLFAAEFLLPREAMMAELTKPVTLASLAPLKSRWGVSLQSLIYRARHLDLITQRQHRYLFEQLGRRRWVRQEPGIARTGVERPRVFEKMAEVLYGSVPDYQLMSDDLMLPTLFIREALSSAHGPSENVVAFGPRNRLP
jgi:Zn-dependent peptidase ImmA (M78 family)/transcriptional regulator with XRE-family HTH domain